MKTLREIDTIRNTKKQLIISQVMQNYISDSKVIHLIPGEISFHSIKLVNESDQRQVYRIEIEDRENNMLEQQEVQLVYSPHEFEHWYK
jgi:hypothetical protein